MLRRYQFNWANLAACMPLVALLACKAEPAPITPDAAALPDTATSFDASWAADSRSDKGWHPDGKVPNTCQPLAPGWDCMLPFPSDWYRGGDGKIAMPEIAAPKQTDNNGGVLGPIDMVSLLPQDGFSVMPQIAVKFPNGVQVKQLIPAYVGDTLNPDFSPSQQPTNLTLLIDAQTKQAVAHFAEIDARTPKPADRFLLIRPVQRLKDGHRYVVALRVGLQDPDGQLIAPPVPFQQLRDQVNAAGVADLRGHYELGIFPVTTAFGVPREQLLLAWDFTTRSVDNATGDMLAVRQLAMESFAKLPVEMTITVVKENPRKDIARQFEGYLKVPLFMDSELAGARLFRGKDGKPTQFGFTQVPFTLVIPPKVWNGETGGPVRIIQCGHGFFGSRDEVFNGVVPKLTQKMGGVGMAVDWWGMSLPDATVLVIDLVQNPSQGLRFVERAYQGMINQMALTWAAQHGLWELAPTLNNGKPSIDGKQVYFYGLSQGHILGGVQVALNPWIDRAVLGVGGASFGLMMSRAAPFGTFAQLLQAATGSEQGATRASLLMIGPLDRIDPGTYAPHLRSDTYPGSPKTRSVLLHAGLSDTQVPNLASHLHARILGIPLLQPSPRTVWGLAPASAPVPEALVEFDFKVPPPDKFGPAPDGGNIVHDGQRHLEASLEQIHRFLKPGGMVEHTCTGVCDPE